MGNPEGIENAGVSLVLIPAIMTVPALTARLCERSGADHAPWGIPFTKLGRSHPARWSAGCTAFSPRVSVLAPHTATTSTTAGMERS